MGGMERTRGGLSHGWQQRAGRRHEPRKRVSEMTCRAGFTSQGGGFPLRRKAMLEHVLQRAAEAFTPPVTRVSPQEALRAVLRSSAVYGDGSSTAPYRADLFALPDSSRVGYTCARSRAMRGLRIFGGVQGEDPLEQ